MLPCFEILFMLQRIYWIVCEKERRGGVRECNDPYADLEDLLFDEEWYPSER